MGVAGQFRGWQFAAYAVYPLILCIRVSSKEVTLKLSLYENNHYPESCFKDFTIMNHEPISADVI